MATYHGSCNCGEVQWDVKLTDDQQKHLICHCLDCQRLSGGPYTLNQLVSLSALTFTKGEDKLKKYTYKGLSGNGVDCFYCSNCTAHPYHLGQAPGNDKIVLRTGLLEKSKGFPVAAEIFCKDMFAYESKIAAATFDGPPPSS